MAGEQPDLAETGSIPALAPRVAAMQNPLDRMLYHPLARRLATTLAPTQVTPNMLSVAGGALIVTAGFAYVQDGGPWMVALGLALHMGWHVLDGADGDLARMTARTSPMGEIVDGLSDYLGHVVLYLMLAGAAFANSGWAIWVLVVVAGFSRIVQANFYESQRRQYLLWVHGVPWLRSSASKAGNEAQGNSVFARAGRAYLWLAGWLAPGDAMVDAGLADARDSAGLRARLEAAGPAALSGSSLLGANYRTLALGASMLAGSPVWFFLFEATLLNLVLIDGAVRARRMVADLRATL